MSLFTAWKDKIEEYAGLRIALLKLTLIERSAKLIGAMMLGFISLGLGLSFLAFVGYGLMQYFVVLFNSKMGGAFATAGIFLLIIIVVMLLRKTIINSIASLFINILTNNADDDDLDASNNKGIPKNENID